MTAPKSQLERVFRVMYQAREGLAPYQIRAEIMNRGWGTDSEAAISARIRDFAKPHIIAQHPKLLHLRVRKNRIGRTYYYRFVNTAGAPAGARTPRHRATTSAGEAPPFPSPARVSQRGLFG